MTDHFRNLRLIYRRVVFLRIYIVLAFHLRHYKQIKIWRLQLLDQCTTSIILPWLFVTLVLDATNRDFTLLVLAHSINYRVWSQGQCLAFSKLLQQKNKDEIPAKLLMFGSYCVLNVIAELFKLIISLYFEMGSILIAIYFLMVFSNLYRVDVRAFFSLIISSEFYISAKLFPYSRNRQIVLRTKLTKIVHILSNISSESRLWWFALCSSPSLMEFSCLWDMLFWGLMDLVSSWKIRWAMLKKFRPWLKRFLLADKDFGIDWRPLLENRFWNPYLE